MNIYNIIVKPLAHTNTHIYNLLSETHLFLTINCVKVRTRCLNEVLFDALRIS